MLSHDRAFLVCDLVENKSRLTGVGVLVHPVLRSHAIDTGCFVQLFATTDELVDCFSCIIISGTVHVSRSWPNTMLCLFQNIS